MNNFFKLRQYYFSFLFSSFFYISVLIIVSGKLKPQPIKDTYIYLLSISSLIILFTAFKRIKGNIFDIKIYRIYLILNQLPLIMGFFFSLTGKNYIYILNGFLIFLIGYMILIPWSRDGLYKKNQKVEK